MADRKLFDMDVDRLPCFDSASGNGSGRRIITDNGHYTANNPEFRTYGTLNLSTVNALSGTRNTLRNRMYHSGDDPTEFCRLKMEYTTNSGTPWQYLKDAIAMTQGGDVWTDNVYNRLRFGVWFAEGHPPPRVETNRINTTFKYYLRHPESASSNQSSKVNFGHGEMSGHTYVYYRGNLIPDTWQFFHVDDHASHILSQTGDWYSLNYPWKDSTEFTPRSDLTWLDGMTYNFFQTDDEVDDAVLPLDAYFDTMLAYTSHADEDSEEVFGITGAYHPGTTELAVSWSVQRNTSYLCDVKYAYSDIRALGWANATNAPNGQNLPSSGDDYNALEYRTTGGIPAGGNDYVYIGVKSQNKPDANFQQIVLPLTANGNPPLPGA